MKYNLANTNRLGNRHNNQDRLGVLERDEAVLLVLADGMGGYKGGEIAAESAVNQMLEIFDHKPLPIEDPVQFFKDAFQQTHRFVIETGLKQQPAMKPRTTLSACLVQDGKVWFAHVGDSRIYLIRDKEVYVRSRDHSSVEELLQSGQITETEALTHPLLNKVTRCIGGQQPTVNVEVSNGYTLDSNDILLLCSDGLWGAIRDERVIDILENNRRLHIATEIMAEQAESASYPRSDNISILAMRWISNERPHKVRLQEQEEEPVVEKQDDGVDQAIDEINEAIKKVNTDIKSA